MKRETGRRTCIFFDFWYAWMFGKVFNSIYYRLPDKVDFIRAFNVKTFYSIFKVIFKYFCKVLFCWNYIIIFSKDYCLIFDNFIRKVRLNSFPQMLVIFNFIHLEIIIEILLWSLEKFNAVVALPFVCQLVFWTIKFS